MEYSSIKWGEKRRGCLCVSINLFISGNYASSAFATSGRSFKMCTSNSLTRFSSISSPKISRKIFIWIFIQLKNRLHTKWNIPHLVNLIIRKEIIKITVTNVSTNPISKNPIKTPIKPLIQVGKLQLLKQPSIINTLFRNHKKIRFVPFKRKIKYLSQITIKFQEKKRNKITISK